MTAVCFSLDESDEISDLKASPDGRFVAMVTGGRELGILDLSYQGPVQVYTRNLEGGFAWSPDSRRLAFIERYPGRPPGLWAIEAAEARRSDKPLVQGFDWIANPQWLGPSRLVYVSDRGSDHINLWQVNADSGEAKKLIDLDEDITAVWAAPGAGEMIYRVSAPARPELWLWEDGEQPILISRDSPNEPWNDTMLTFSPTGLSAVWITPGLVASRIVFYKLDELLEVSSPTVSDRVESLALESDKMVVIGMNSRIYRWNPYKGDAGSISKGRDWDGVRLTHPVQLGLEGWAAVVGGDLIVTARDLGRLGDGSMHARSVRAMVHLAVDWLEAGQNRRARSVLQDLWDHGNGDPSTRVAIAAAMARAERVRGKPKRAVPWLEKATAPADSIESGVDSAWMERLLMAVFELDDQEEASRLLDAMGESIRERPMAVWVADLLDEEGDALKGWRKTAVAFRARQWSKCADRLANLIGQDGNSAINRRGVDFILRGRLEPLTEVIETASAPHPDLLKNFRFQQILLALAGDDLSDEIGKDDLRGMLLLQWSEAGQLTAARRLVELDLRDPEGSSLDYTDMLDRYLDPEERVDWMEMAVERVLLASEVKPLLDRQMVGAREHLIYWLARAKAALVLNRVEDLEEALRQLEHDLTVIPAEFWDKRTAKYLLLVRLYRTKYFESREMWDKALEGYKVCFGVMDDYPGDWGIAAFDMEMARGLIEAGRDNSDLLHMMLGVIRGLGDPLINPGHEPRRIHETLGNLRTLRAHGAEPWLMPYITYYEGASLSLVNRPWEALVAIGRTRDQNPASSLEARVILEQAAIRAALGQVQLTIALTDQLFALGLAPPLLAVVIGLRAQTESEYGLIRSLENRVRYLCREQELPRRWSATLIADHTVLPLDEKAGASEEGEGEEEKVE